MKVLHTIPILILLVCTSSSAQPYSLPEGKTVNNKKQYTLDEFKTILKIHADYLNYFNQIQLHKNYINDLIHIQDRQANQLKLRSNTIKTLQTDRNRIYQKWLTENKKRHLAENKSDVTSIIGWSLAGVSTTVLVVLLVYMGVTK